MRAKKKKNEVRSSITSEDGDVLQANLREIPQDLLNDVQIAFDLYKNPKNGN